MVDPPLLSFLLYLLCTRCKSLTKKKKERYTPWFRGRNGYAMRRQILGTKSSRGCLSGPRPARSEANFTLPSRTFAASEVSGHESREVWFRGRRMRIRRSSLTRKLPIRGGGDIRQSDGSRRMPACRRRAY